MTSLEHLRRGPQLPPPGWREEHGILLPPCAGEVLRCGSGMAVMSSERRRAATPPPVWTPADLGPTAWWEEQGYSDTTGTTPISSASDTIALLKNRGSLGSAADASQATAGARPGVQQVSPLVPLYNGPTALVVGASAVVVADTACTLWLRWRAIDLTARCALNLHNLASGYDQLWTCSNGLSGYTQGIILALGQAGAAAGSGGTLVGVAMTADTAWHTLIAVRTPDGTPAASDPSEYTIYLDGVPRTVVSTGAALSPGTSTLGRRTDYSDGIRGSMPSVGRCSYAITSAQAAQLHTYLSTKFS